MSKLMKERIKALMEERNLTANALSAKAGLDRSTVGKFLSKPGATLSPANAEAVARVLKCSVAVLRGEADADSSKQAAETYGKRPSKKMGSPPQHMLSAFLVVGIVEAGAFRPVDWFEETDLGTVMSDVPSDLRGLRHFAYEVRGDSMNQVGMTEGDKVICVDPYEVEYGSGDYVVVERSTNGGHTRELTVKEVSVGDDGTVELLPRSTNTKHVPIRFEPSEDHDDGVTVSIVGVICSVVKQIRLRRSMPRLGLATKRVDSE